MATRYKGAELEDTAEVAGVFQKFTNAGIEVATAFASGSSPSIHGRCHQRNGQAQNKHSTWADGDSPGPGDRGKIQPHPC